MSDGGVKFDAGKLRFDLLPVEAVESVIAVLNFGSAKYGDRNWERGIHWSRLFAAAMRHSWAWWRGEDLDKESGLSHMAHAACCMLMLLQYVCRASPSEYDDRPVGGGDASR